MFKSMVLFIIIGFAWVYISDIYYLNRMKCRRMKNVSNKFNDDNNYNY